MAKAEAEAHGPYIINHISLTFHVWLSFSSVIRDPKGLIDQVSSESSVKMCVCVKGRGRDKVEVEMDPPIKKNLI